MFMKENIAFVIFYYSFPHKKIDRKRFEFFQSAIYNLFIVNLIIIIFFEIYPFYNVI